MLLQHHAKATSAYTHVFVKNHTDFPVILHPLCGRTQRKNFNFDENLVDNCVIKDGIFSKMLQFSKLHYIFKNVPF